MINRRNRRRKSDMINKEIDYPNIADLKIEKFNFPIADSLKKDGLKLFSKKYHLYACDLIKISNSESYIFATEEALKLILHINTFKNYEFDMNNKYCLNAYKLLSNAIENFKEVREVFSFSIEGKRKLKIQCLSTKLMFPIDVKIDAIKEYMKYYMIEPKKYSSSISPEIQEYIPLRNVLFQYKVEVILNKLIDSVDFIEVQKGEIILNDEILEKCKQMYEVLYDREITNSFTDLSIGTTYDEFSEKREIYIREGENIVQIENLSLDDWLNANIKSYDLFEAALSLREIVMVHYYNKKSKFKEVDKSEPDMFAGLDEIGRENLINMLEP